MSSQVSQRKTVGPGRVGTKIIREEAGRERVSRRKRGKDTIFRIQKLITALCECCSVIILHSSSPSPSVPWKIHSPCVDDPRT
jgi:hypothetical protein